MKVTERDCTATQYIMHYTLNE